MGNKLARNRLKAQDFNYIANNTAFLTMDVSKQNVSFITEFLCQVVRDYYNEIIEKFGNTGQMDPDTFQRIFMLAFPERPQDKVELLVKKLRNVEKTSGDIRKNFDMNAFCSI